MSETANHEISIEPNSDLGKLLLVIVQSIGSLEPQAFVNVDVANAIRQADAIKS